MIARHKPFLVLTGACFLVIFVLRGGYFRIWKAPPDKVVIISQYNYVTFNFVGCISKGVIMVCVDLGETCTILNFMCK